MNLDFQMCQAVELEGVVLLEAFDVTIHVNEPSSRWHLLSARMTRAELEHLRALISSTLRDADDIAHRLEVAKGQLALVWSEAEQLATTAKTAFQTAK